MAKTKGSPKQGKLKKALARYEAASAALTEFKAKHKKVLAALRELEAEQGDALDEVKTEAQAASSLKKLGEQSLITGERFLVTNIITRPREVDFKALTEACPEVITWPDIARVNLKHFDAAVSAGIVDPDTAGQVVTPGKPRHKVVLKPLADA